MSAVDISVSFSFSFKAEPPQFVSRFKSNLGNGVKTLSRKVQDVARGCVKSVALFFDATSRVFGSKDALQDFVKIPLRVITALKLQNGSVTQSGENILTQVGKAESMMDLFHLPGSIHYFMSGGPKKSPMLKTAAMASFMVCGVTSWLSWLREVGLISLGKISAEIGKLPVVGGVVKYGLGTTGLFFATVGKSFFTILSIKAIMRNEANRHTWFELTDGVVNVAFRALLLAGMGTPIVYLALGVTAASTSVVTFLHGQYYNKA